MSSINPVRQRLTKLCNVLLLFSGLAWCGTDVIATPATAATPAADTAPAAAMAGDSPPSDASIQELLEVTDAHQLIDGLRVQVDAMVSAAAQQARQGKAVTPEVQGVLDRMHAKMLAVADETLNWDTMQGICIRTYRASFTQDELDSIIAFYKTAAGRALVKKMPAVLHNVMTEMQGATSLMREKIRQIQLDTMNELNSLPAAKPANPTT
jgi:hypothetical protein